MAQNCKIPFLYLIYHGLLVVFKPHISYCSQGGLFFSIDASQFNLDVSDTHISGL